MDNSNLVTFPAMKMQVVSLPDVVLQTRKTAFIDMVLGQKLPIATLLLTLVPASNCAKVVIQQS